MPIDAQEAASSTSGESSQKRQRLADGHDAEEGGGLPLSLLPVAPVDPPVLTAPAPPIADEPSEETRAAMSTIAAGLAQCSLVGKPADAGLQPLSQAVIHKLLRQQIPEAQLQQALRGRVFSALMGAGAAAVVRAAD